MLHGVGVGDVVFMSVEMLSCGLQRLDVDGILNEEIRAVSSVSQGSVFVFCLFFYLFTVHE